MIRDLLPTPSPCHGPKKGVRPDINKPFESPDLERFLGHGKGARNGGKEGQVHVRRNVLEVGTEILSKCVSGPTPRPKR